MGFAVVLTERDKKIFLDLKNYSVMTTAQLAKRHFPKIAITTVLRRFRKLEKDRYIQRLNGLDTNERCWALGRKAAIQFSDKIPRASSNHHTLHHDVTLVDLRLLLEDTGIAHAWTPEHILKAKIAREHGASEARKKPVPDGIMITQVDRKSASINIELELHYKNRKRYQDLFGWYTGREGVWALWYIVHSKSLGRHLSNLWQKDFGRYSYAHFIWSELDDVMKNGSNAVLHCKGRDFKMSEIWECKRDEAAHASALGVSRAVNENDAICVDLNTENEKKTLAQVS